VQEEREDEVVAIDEAGYREIEKVDPDNETKFDA
jgi:hypothetical protein